MGLRVRIRTMGLLSFLGGFLACLAPDAAVVPEGTRGGLFVAESPRGREAYAFGDRAAVPLTLYEDATRKGLLTFPCPAASLGITEGRVDVSTVPQDGFYDLPPGEVMVGSGLDPTVFSEAASLFTRRAAWDEAGTLIASRDLPFLGQAEVRVGPLRDRVAVVIRDGQVRYAQWVFPDRSSEVVTAEPWLEGNKLLSPVTTVAGGEPELFALSVLPMPADSATRRMRLHRLLTQSSTTVRGAQVSDRVVAWGIEPIGMVGAPDGRLLVVGAVGSLLSATEYVDDAWSVPVPLGLQMDDWVTAGYGGSGDWIVATFDGTRLVNPSAGAVEPYPDHVGAVVGGPGDLWADVAFGRGRWRSPRGGLVDVPPLSPRIAHYGTEGGGDELVIASRDLVAVLARDPACSRARVRWRGESETAILEAGLIEGGIVFLITMGAGSQQWRIEWRCGCAGLADCPCG